MLDFFVTMNTINGFRNIKYSIIPFSNETLAMWTINLKGLCYDTNRHTSFQKSINFFDS